MSIVSEALDSFDQSAGGHDASDSEVPAVSLGCLAGKDVRIGYVTHIDVCDIKVDNRWDLPGHEVPDICDGCAHRIAV